MRDSLKPAKHSTLNQPKLVLLDRDGVLNEDSPAYIRAPTDWQSIPGSMEALALLHQADIRCALCTNQAGIGRGIFDHHALAAIHQQMEKQIAAAGGKLELIRYCPHHPEAGCGCRKPKTGMLIDCLTELSVAPEDTLFVGDSLHDMQAALSARCQPVLVRHPKAGRNETELEAQARALGVRWFYPDLASLVEDLISL